jgi:hypothetical protein
MLEKEVLMVASRFDANGRGVRILPLFEWRIDYRIWRVLAISWMGLLFLLSSQSTLPTPSLFAGQDKLMHAGAFGVLAFFLTRSFRPPKERLSNRDVLVVILIVLGYGFLDELRQLFVSGRDASLWDLVADLVGGTLSALIFRRR